MHETNIYQYFFYFVKYDFKIFIEPNLPYTDFLILSLNKENANAQKKRRGYRMVLYNMNQKICIRD